MQFVSRVQTCPSLAVLCGNSEVSQQAAMLGLPRDLWSNAFFDRDLPAIVGDFRPDVPYWPSTPGGGTLPFNVRTGVSHYYGVGAYRRPLEDARRCGVRFTAECLAFSHVPEDATIDLVLTDGQSPFHHPAWKARVPRDAGAGWDFEDVRDHYLGRLFGVDAATLRSQDMSRYLALSRVVTGEVLANVLGEWRRGESSCRGALVWFFRDLWPGAGWGLVDSTGLPKAAFYFVRRALQPVALVTTDEGLDGLALHAINDTEAPIEAELDLGLYRRDGVLAVSGRMALTLGARSTVTVSSDTLLGQFLDVTYAYRFGPPDRDLAVGTLRSRGDVLGKSFYFPLGHAFAPEHDLGIQATARPFANGAYVLNLKAKRFAQAIAIGARGYVARDNYFHLEPGAERDIVLRPIGAPQPFKGTVRPLNALASTEIMVSFPGAPS
jgi:beta-mannosidase